MTKNLQWRKERSQQGSPDPTGRAFGGKVQSFRQGFAATELKVFAFPLTNRVYLQFTSDISSLETISHRLAWDLLETIFVYMRA